MIDQAVTELTPLVGTRAACSAVGEAQARWYRRHRQSPPPPKPDRVPAGQPRALSLVERKELRRTLNSEEHVDEAPATVYAKLLDEGVYLASVSTMYRVLHDHDEVHERRRQATHPAAKKPELSATKANKCWSWDITKLLGPEKWTYYYLYVIIDIYSRYAPGWMLAHAENARLAEALLADTVAKQNIETGQLTIHADRGSPMTAKPVAFLLADLGVTKSHSRPHTSNDNPYSESQFRTLKYRPEFPARFGCFEDAHAHCNRFFTWYNDEHRHSGIGYHTPADVHYGRAEAMRHQRDLVLDAAYAEHPERFVRKVARRDTTSAGRRARAAGLDPTMTLDRWDSTAKVTYDRAIWDELCSLRFVDSAHNAIVMGPVGVGKTFLATALGHIAVRRRTISGASS